MNKYERFQKFKLESGDTGKSSDYLFALVYDEDLKVWSAFITPAKFFLKKGYMADWYLKWRHHDWTSPVEGIYEYKDTTLSVEELYNKLKKLGLKYSTQLTTFLNYCRVITYRPERS